MFSNIGSFELRRWLLPPVLLLAASAGVRPWELALGVPAKAPAMTLAGTGTILPVIGGMRTVVAGGLWLRTNLAWERRDAIATMTSLHLTVAADERPMTFWLNGARMIAYDLPEWRSEGAPAAVRQRNRVEQAHLAIGFLERGMATRGPAAEFYVEMANIRLRVLGDREGAARLFRLAAGQPGAPYYAARIHAGLLCDLGRRAEALAWLRGILPSLPADDPAARRAVVLARIKELEQETGRK